MFTDSSENDSRDLALSYLYLRRRKQLRKKKRAIWVTEWKSNRDTEGAMAKIYRELEAGDGADYRNFVRMNINDFNFILGKIKHRIEKQDTIMRRAIPAEERLAVTLRYLASGNSMIKFLVIQVKMEQFKYLFAIGADYGSMMYLFRISRPALSKIIPDYFLA